jgi:hypothetical protein
MGPLSLAGLIPLSPSSNTSTSDSPSSPSPDSLDLSDPSQPTKSVKNFTTERCKRAITHLEVICTEHNTKEDDIFSAVNCIGIPGVACPSEALARASPPQETRKKNEEPEREDSEEPEEGEISHSYSKSHSASRSDILQDLGRRPGHDHSV